MKFPKFFGGRKEQESPVLDEAQRIIENAEDDLVRRALIQRDHLQNARDFLDGYSVSKQKGPESIYAIVRDNMTTVLDESPETELVLSLRKSEFVMFLQFRLAYAGIIEQAERDKIGYTKEVQDAFVQITGAFSGT